MLLHQESVNHGTFQQEKLSIRVVAPVVIEDETRPRGAGGVTDHTRYVVPEVAPEFLVLNGVGWGVLRVTVVSKDRDEAPGQTFVADVLTLVPQDVDTRSPLKHHLTQRHLYAVLRVVALEEVRGHHRYGHVAVLLGLGGGDRDRNRNRSLII